jgi:hypothetical protein
MEQSRTKGGFGGLVLLVAAVIAIILLGGGLVTAPDLTKVQVGSHAVERHGDDAVRARALIAQPGTRWYRCNDGRERGVADDPENPNNFAVQILEGGREVTAFFTDKAGVTTMLNKDGCSNGFAHP